MEIPTDQQIFDQIKKSSKILVLLPQASSPDSLASGLGLKLFLTKLEKEVFLASSGTVPENLKFLPGSAGILHEITAGKNFVISLNIKEKKLEQISYQAEGDKVNIYLKPAAEQFTPQDLTFTTEKSDVDLIITLGAASVEDFGKTYEQHAELFFETPKINIDNQAANEYFGSINLVDVTAASLAEILADLMAKQDAQLIDPDIATCLLAGIIAKTHSFQGVRTTPRAFLKASELVGLGARQQEIVKHIYRTKSLSLLKLWGRALARMKINELQQVVYSVLSAADFDRAESSEQDLFPAFSEFLENLSGYKIMAFLAEVQPGQIKLLAAVHEQLQPENFAQKAGGKISDFVLPGFKIITRDFEGSPDDLERTFLQAVESTVDKAA